MNSRFVDAFRCEWLKKRRSLGAWLVVVGAFFTPGIVTLARLIRREHLPTLYAAPEFWTSLWRSSWESMAVFFVPMAAILTTSLVVQIEVRNNAWKQVHALPRGAHDLSGEVRGARADARAVLPAVRPRHLSLGAAAVAAGRKRAVSAGVAAARHVPG
ncbi:ABC transporter permease [Nannocystis pusilla]|uniref:ABC transporter permease n=1 Tax=Nannocystis pusilla TaxID=889268 RepID=UPI003B81C4CD